MDEELFKAKVEEARTDTLQHIANKMEKLANHKELSKEERLGKGNFYMNLMQFVRDYDELEPTMIKFYKDKFDKER